MRTLHDAIGVQSPKMDNKEQEKNIADAILSLPEDQQIILVMHYKDGRSIKEISSHLNCSVSTIYSRLNKAIFNLKNKLNPSALEKMYTILYPETKKPASMLTTVS